MEGISTSRNTRSVLYFMTASNPCFADTHLCSICTSGHNLLRRMLRESRQCASSSIKIALIIINRDFYDYFSTQRVSISRNKIIDCNPEAVTMHHGNPVSSDL